MGLWGGFGGRGGGIFGFFLLGFVPLRRVVMTRPSFWCWIVSQLQTETETDYLLLVS